MGGAVLECPVQIQFQNSAFIALFDFPICSLRKSRIRISVSMMMFLVKACQLANWVNPCRHRSQLKSPTQFDGFINQTLGHHLTDLTLFYKSFLSQLPIILLTHVCFVYTEVAGLCWPKQCPPVVTSMNATGIFSKRSWRGRIEI